MVSFPKSRVFDPNADYYPAWGRMIFLAYRSNGRGIRGPFRGRSAWAAGRALEFPGMTLGVLHEDLSIADEARHLLELHAERPHAGAEDLDVLHAPCGVAARRRH